MRARSVQLVTSWWVVGVWAALGILTGVMSVVTVLQPSWYVRYSLLHAQEAPRGVVYQVMVSSVGPLGFCRLTGVDTSQVSRTSTKSHTSYTKSPPSPVQDPKEGISSTTPSVWTVEETSASSSPPEETSRNPELLKNTTSSKELLHQTSRFPNESSPEWPPLGVHYTTLPVESVHSDHTLPALVTPTEGDGAHVSEDGRKEELLQAFWTSKNTDNGVTNEAQDTATVLSPVTETYVEVVEEEREDKESILQGEKDLEAGVTTDREEAQQGIPNKHDSAQTPVRNITRYEVDDFTEQEVNHHRNLAGFNIRTGQNENPERKNTTTTKKKNRRRKNKQRKRRKKNRRPKSKKDRRNKLWTVGREREYFSTRERKRNEKPSQAYTRQDKMIASTDQHHHITADFLTQPKNHHDRHHDRHYDDLEATYHPRTPILVCSGVGVGSGSSSVWVLVGVVYGVAGVVQVIAGVVSLALNATKAHARRYTVAVWVGNVQVAIVMSQGVALVLFPLGLGSPLARGECGGSSSVYWSGDCSFGWSYMLGIVSTTLAAYCPCLARLTIFRRYGLKEWESINFY